MITVADDYFTKGCGRCKRFDTDDCSTRLWHQGLADLRQICLSAGLVEAVKWGHPCYMWNNRNVALIGAFRGEMRLNFMNAGLLKDPEGVLEVQGENAKTPSMIRFTDKAGVSRLRTTILAYLTEAKSYAEAGLKAPKVETALEFPEELTEVLDNDPELAEAFHALTPGRQKSYLFNLNGAKKPETRYARIAKFRDMILAGKGALDR